MFQCFLDLLRGWGFPWPLCGMVLFAQSRVKLCLEGRVGDSHADLKSGLGVSCMLFVHLYGGEQSCHVGSAPWGPPEGPFCVVLPCGA